MRVVFLAACLWSLGTCVDFAAMKKENFISDYLNGAIPVSDTYKGLALSFYPKPQYSQDLVMFYQKSTKVHWTKLYNLEIQNSFFGVKNSNYLMAVFNFLKSIHWSLLCQFCYVSYIISVLESFCYGYSHESFLIWESHDFINMCFYEYVNISLLT